MTAAEQPPATHPDSRPGLVTVSLIGLVRVYRVAVSPVLAPSCRYWPSCSEYAIDALREHGAWRGGMMAAGRLLRCTPWHAGGVDPVPPASPPPVSRNRSRWQAYREPAAREHPTTDSSSP